MVSAVYGTGVRVRNRLYDRGLLKSHSLSAPVISVGNIAVGGSGKTPFVMLLAELLQQQNVRFDVLSRGYRRRTHGVLAVDPNGTAADFGDEPLLIARRIKCPVVVGEKRYQAGIYAERRFKPQLHILDDGFQHRSLARDLDIVLLSPDDLRDRMLPSGRLREPVDSLRRADIIVLTGEINRAELPVTDKLVWNVRRGVRVEHAPERPIVFCGIARPDRFVEQLKALGIVAAATSFYRDHHQYSEKDIAELIALRDKHQAEGFISTEKDAVNLGDDLERLGVVSIAEVTMELSDTAGALDTLLRVISDHKPAS